MEINKYHSIVIPFYNEEANVTSVINRVTSIMDNLSLNFEIIAVEDGSSDQTYNVLKLVRENNQHLKIIKFRRNFGQTQAMQAGIDNACGDVIITMDGDMQNDPSDIPDLLNKMEKGDYGVVSGWRKKRKDSALRCIPSHFANFLLRYVTGVNIHDNGCSLKAYDAKILKKVHLYSDMHRFITAFACLNGAKVGEMEVNHYPRTKGVSKYGFSRIWKVLVDLFTLRLVLHFSERPMSWFGFMSAISVFVASFITLFWLTQGSYGIVWPGVILLFMFNGFVLLGYGLVCELTVQAKKMSDKLKS